MNYLVVSCILLVCNKTRFRRREQTGFKRKKLIAKRRSEPKNGGLMWRDRSDKEGDEWTFRG